MRIASLLSCATEMVYALGLGDRLVARSHGCDYPGNVLSLPVVTEPKINVHASSVEIDRQVKEVVMQTGSVYRVDAGLLESLRPDFIVTQQQCEVCAVSYNDVVEAVRRFETNDVQIFSLNPMTLSDVLDEIRRLGDTLQAAQEAQTVLQNIHRRMECVDAHGKYHPSVAFIEWLEPMMIGGNWIPDLIGLAGGRPVAGESGQHSRFIETEFLYESDPDVIVIAPCGFQIPQTLREIRILTGHARWKSLKAVQSDNVYVADGHFFFNRSGPRLVDSLEIMSYILQPHARDHYRHLSGWVHRLTS